jgi:tetratricopeptide (TPR) repeat protein
MQKINALLDSLRNRLFSSTYQLQRVIILTAIALVLAVISFGGYYYYDRYYTSQPKIADVSIEQAEKFVSEDPQNADKRVALAETYLINRRYDDAITAAKEVLKAYPDQERAMLVIGIASNVSGKPADAIEPLKKIMDANKDVDMAGLRPELISAAYYLGDSYLQLNQPEKAIAPLQQAVNWNGTDADAMYKLGIAYLGTKDYEKSLIMFHSATTFVPDFIEAYEGMIAAYEATNQPALAKYAQGMVAYSKKDYQSAVKLLLESVQQEPAFAPTFAGLGQSYEALNDLPNAKTSFETALKLDPNNFTASNGLKRVEILLQK